MLRPFDWRDFSLVKALGEDGVCLDSEIGLTQGTRPLQQALLTYLMPMAGPPTVIWRGRRRSGGNGHGQNGEERKTSRPAVFGQARQRHGDEHARLLYMAPAPNRTADGWYEVLDRLAVEAGERRAQNLVADVHERSPAFEILREAGFAIYARQSLWRLAPGAGPSTEADAGDGAVTLRPAVRADTIAVQTLYSNVVPRLVQQVEPGPQHIDRGYVLDVGGDLLAFLDVRRGPQGIWVEPVLHPEAYDLAEAVVKASLKALVGRNDKPLYVCVRRYQHWLQEVVEQAGFESAGAQAVMVKRLAVRVGEAVLKPLPVVEGQVATPISSARFTRGERERQSGGRSNGKTAYRWQPYAKTNNGRPGSPDEGATNTHLRKTAGIQSV